MTFEYYNIVSNTTGEIIRQLGGDTSIESNIITDNTPSGTTAYLGLQTDTNNEFYYITGTKTSRLIFSSVGSWDKQSIVANGTDTATFSSSLPNPTQIVVSVPNGLNIPGPINETSGSFSVNTTVPGDYIVTFISYPYKQQSYTITAS